MRWAEYAAGIKIKSFGKKLWRLGKSRGTWVDNIKANLKEIEWRVVNWSGLTENRGEWTYLMNMVTNLQVLWNEKNFAIATKTQSPWDSTLVRNNCSCIWIMFHEHPPRFILGQHPPSPKIKWDICDLFAPFVFSPKKLKPSDWTSSCSIRFSLNPFLEFPLYFLSQFKRKGARRLLVSVCN